MIQPACSPEPGRLLLIACGALAREIDWIIKVNSWSHVDLTCLPAILHNHPERIPDRVRAAVEQHRCSYSRIAVVYADCGTGGQLASLCRELGVEMMEGPHCYSFFSGNAAFSALADSEFTALYLTDFLVRQFDAFLWRPLGLDRHPELRNQYFAHYDKLVYLDQVGDDTLVHTARQHAVRLGLEFEHRHTGFGDLDTQLRAWSDAVQPPAPA